MKLISDSYLYQVADYNKKIFEYLVSSERVDKNSDAFSDVVYSVKKQANTILMKVLLSNNVVLLMDKNGGTSRAFKVIRTKDIKDPKQKRRVFIDCTGVISYENGVYKCTKIGTLISYLMAAMTYIIYYEQPSAILTNNTIMKSGTEAFVDMMLYTLGYLKVPVTYMDNKEKMSFVLAEYFQLCVAGANSTGDTVYNIAKQVSGMKDKKGCDFLHTLFIDTFDEGKCDFNKFLAKFAEVFLDQIEGKNSPKNRAVLTVDTFVNRWMYAYGPSTFLGLECFVPFSQIITDCYNGSFINQQNTIEKVVGGKNVTVFSNELLKVGSENA